LLAREVFSINLGQLQGPPQGADGEFAMRRNHCDDGARRGVFPKHDVAATLPDHAEPEPIAEKLDGVES
jgi:hypothetical protein